ncbi:MAG: D-sedoheptulose 7-phosphate isomerase [Pseudohongiellaceae bacterium]|jgi:D-sedoheptulose 7-phosphate isomerase
MPSQTNTHTQHLQLIEATFAQHRDVLTATAEQMPEVIAQAAALLVDCYLRGGKAILFGNGGSMSDALHLEGELVNRFSVDRKGVAAVALASPASFTATANDYSYDDVFARMLEAHQRPGDVAIGFTTSGNSENVVRALELGQQAGTKTIAMTGMGGGRCAAVSDVLLAVPSDCTPRIQEMHITIGHMLCDAIEKALLART